MKTLTTLIVLFLTVPAIAETGYHTQEDVVKPDKRVVEKAEDKSVIDSDLTEEQLDELASIWAQLIGQRKVGEMSLEDKIAKLKKKQERIERKLQKLVDRLEEQNKKKIIGEVRKRNERIDLRPIQGAVDAQELMKHVIEVLSRNK